MRLRRRRRERILVVDVRHRRLLNIVEHPRVRRRYPFVRVGRHRHAQVGRRGVEDPFHLHHGVGGQFAVDEERGRFVVIISIVVAVHGVASQRRADADAAR